MASARLTFDELVEWLDEAFTGEERVRFTVMPLVPGAEGRPIAGPAGLDVFGEFCDMPSIIETHDDGVPERHLCISLEGGGHIAIGEPEFEGASVHDVEKPQEVTLYLLGLVVTVSLSPRP